MLPLELFQRLFVVGLLVSWLVLSHGAGRTQAQQFDTDHSHLYNFGLHLFHLGDYYRAITELKRFTLLFPHHPLQPPARIVIGLAFQEDQAYDAAATHFQRLDQTDSAPDVERLAAFKVGELLLVQQQYQEATARLQDFLVRFPAGPLASHATYLLGLSWALAGQPDQARAALASLSPDDAWSKQALALHEELQTRHQLTQKSPRLAGFLSGVLPGAGHLYAGKPLHALGAFVLNGLFLAGAAYAIHEGFEVTGAILLFFETGWYLGSINSAMDAAREANQQQQRMFAAHLRATYAPPLLTLQHLQAPALGLRFAF